MNMLFSVKAFFVSIEMLFMLIVVSIFYFDKSLFDTTANELFLKNGEGRQTIVLLLMSGYLTPTLYFLKLFLFPNEKANRKFLLWEKYSEYRAIVIVGLFYIMMGAFVTIVLLIFRDLIINAYIGLLYIGLTGASYISIFSLVNAHFRVREYLEKYEVESKEN